MRTSTAEPSGVTERRNRAAATIGVAAESGIPRARAPALKTVPPTGAPTPLFALDIECTLTPHLRPNTLKYLFAFCVSSVFICLFVAFLSGVPLARFHVLSTPPHTQLPSPALSATPLDMWGVRCNGANGCILFALAMHRKAPQLMLQVRKLVEEWEAGDPSDTDHLLIAFNCVRGRHRSKGIMFLVSYVLRMLGFLVYTEAPDDRERGYERNHCKCPYRCPKYKYHDDTFWYWEEDARTAGAIASRSSQIRYVYYPEFNGEVARATTCCFMFLVCY